MSAIARLAAAVLVALSAWAGSAQAAQAAAAAESRKLHALFERHWAANERTYPEGGTYRGDHRYGDRLTDVSPAARRAQDAAVRRWLHEAQAIRRGALPAADRLSLDLFIDKQQRAIDLMPHRGWRSMTLGALDGAQTALADLMLVTPVDTRAQVLQLLARLRAAPRRVDDEITRLREGLALGWVPPRPVLARALEQIDKQLAPAIDDGPFFEPLRRLPREWAAAERDELQAQARRLIEQQVLPAMRRLRAFIAGEFLGHAPSDGALSRYPGGSRVYQTLVRQQTTTALTARQIHDTGLRELARLRGEMEAVLREVRFEGDFAGFIAFLDRDPRFAYADAQALLAHYRDIGKRVDAELPKLFAALPRAGWGVQAMPPHAGADAAEYYQQPADDGSRAGVFFVNTLAWARKRTWEAETLVAHEAVPGHHLQTARAIEQRDLPRFRRDLGYVAYVEGWALYAEALGFELGLYTDPYSRFGHLQWQAFRAARLVVDTGIHAFGWSRERAIDYMVERTGVERGFVAAEVDRYTSDPGQALGYMVGKLKIDALRARAQARLGARLDLRRFHDMLLDQGALPLDLLERVADEWIAREWRRRPRR